MPRRLFASLWMAWVHHNDGFASSFAPLDLAAIRFAPGTRPGTRLWENKFVDKGGVPSYSDNWLFRHHNDSQQDYQLKTSAVEKWNTQRAHEEASIVEWQGSFQRNGLADFTPPMTTSGLNCLLVGADVEMDAGTGFMTKTNGDLDRDSAPQKLPWENEAEADITSLRASVQLTAPEDVETAIAWEPGNTSQAAAAGLRIRTELVQSSSTAATTKTTSLRASSEQAGAYDCIVDQGLLGSVLLTTCDVTAIQELLEEASFSLREHGIYVLTTLQLPDRIKAMLEKLGLEVGLEWQFALDGVSNDDTQISVARRFNAGAMPSGNAPSGRIFKTIPGRKRPTGTVLPASGALD